jgi:hypothetical protein
MRHKLLIGLVELLAAVFVLLGKQEATAAPLLQLPWPSGQQHRGVYTEGRQRVVMFRLWILPVLGLIAVLAVACSDENEDVQSPSPTVTSVSLSPASTSPSATTPVVTASPGTTVPADWKTYADPNGKFSARYPSGWFAEHGTFSTFRLGSIGPTFPPGAVKIDVGVNPLSILGACATPAPDSVPATVDGQPGWRISSNGTTPDVEESAQVFVQNGASCYGILGIFGYGSAGMTLFDRFLGGLSLGEK